MRLIIERDGHNPFHTIRKTVAAESLAARNSRFCKFLSKAAKARAQALIIVIKAVVATPFVCLAAALKVLSGLYTITFALLNCKFIKIKESLPEFFWAGKIILATILVIVMSVFCILLPEVMIRNLQIYRCSKLIYIPWCEKKYVELERNVVPQIKGFTIKKVGDTIQVEDKDMPKNDQVVDFLHTITKQRYRMFLQG